VIGRSRLPVAVTRVGPAVIAGGDASGGRRRREPLCSSCCTSAHSHGLVSVQHGRGTVPPCGRAGVTTASSATRRRRVLSDTPDTAVASPARMTAGARGRGPATPRRPEGLDGLSPDEDPGQARARGGPVGGRGHLSPRAPPTSRAGRRAGIRWTEMWMATGQLLSPFGGDDVRRRAGRRWSNAHFSVVRVVQCHRHPDRQGSTGPFDHRLGL
jgi:hypothetical protein